MSHRVISHSLIPYEEAKSCVYTVTDPAGTVVYQGTDRKAARKAYDTHGGKHVKDRQPLPKAVNWWTVMEDIQSLVPEPILELVKDMWNPGKEIQERLAALYKEFPEYIRRNIDVKRPAISSH